MEIKTTKTVEAIFTINDLKEVLSEKLGMSAKDVDLNVIMNQESWQISNLETESYDVFAGIKITYKQ